METLKAQVAWFTPWITTIMPGRYQFIFVIWIFFVSILATGNWVVQKTTNSAMSVDQAHEQNNTHVKGSGGAVDLTREVIL